MYLFIISIIILLIQVCFRFSWEYIDVFPYINSTTKPEKHKEHWTSKQQQGYGVGIESHLEDAQQP